MKKDARNPIQISIESRRVRSDDEWGEALHPSCCKTNMDSGANSSGNLVKNLLNRVSTITFYKITNNMTENLSV